MFDLHRTVGSLSILPRLHRLTAAALMVAAVICAVALGAGRGQAAPPAGSARSAEAAAPAGVLRVGTYDSRAVAVAYVRSEASAQKAAELVRQHSEAQQRGDRRRMAELTAQGEALQVRRHLQGFSTAPVDDVLETVRERLPEVAQRANVALITRQADHHAASVELVDVTDDLVRLFDPDAKTLELIRDLRKREPAAIEDVARMPARG